MPCSARATPVSLGLAFRKLVQASQAYEPRRSRMRASHICGFPQNITVARANKGKREITVGSVRGMAHTGVERWKRKKKEKRKEERKREKKRKSSEEERMEEKEGEERVHRLERLLRSLPLPPPPLSFLLAAASLLSAILLDPRFSLAIL